MRTDKKQEIETLKEEIETLKEQVRVLLKKEREVEPLLDLLKLALKS